ncbi:uncharacterized protein LOC115921019 [Strongylocentrotus purpuratus]|uniref:Uncharacterized protein n=1 Tax=Strongylocentrotus purpuratus TaxID=7668 RepID=A0A7M7NAS0_STRPU|nr:uncharacterized protein LOC115918245 isoform X2 [Strongylocentrotus purpuratus]XP_030833816.1 uncharacterized protein LOC115921019 [Strongylocentrotus purpuratus]|eukprot:XP_011672626.1 PREDICTED: uncharacterized protein LOC105442332 [Strongylocentrotus purpuratus]
MAGTLGSGKKGMMYMFLVEAFHQRRTQGTSTDQAQGVREFLKGNVVIKGGGNAIYDVYINDPGNRDPKQVEKVLAMSCDQHFGIRNGICDELNLRVTVNLKSQIFLTGAPFEIPRDAVREYRHPALLSIREIHKSPAKRRATVRGVVSEVGEVRTVRGEKRVRNILLKDGEDSIGVSLWEEHTGVAVTVDQRIEVTPVVVSEFNSRKRLESTATMKLQMVICNAEFQGVLMAVSDDEYKIPYELILLDDGDERVLTVNQKSLLVDIDLSRLPCSVKGEVESEGLKEVVVKLEKMLD